MLSQSGSNPIIKTELVETVTRNHCLYERWIYTLGDPKGDSGWQAGEYEALKPLTAEGVPQWTRL